MKPDGGCSSRQSIGRALPRAYHRVLGGGAHYRRPAAEEMIRPAHVAKPCNTAARSHRRVFLKRRIFS
jgi:hypothetical protein